MNLHKEGDEMVKKSRNKEFDIFFHTMVDKLGKGSKFDVGKKTLYLGKDIKSDNEYLRTLQDGYKFLIGKSLT